MSNWVELKREFKSQRGEGIYKDNNNNSFLNLMQKIKIEWKMEIMIAPSNKHRFLSNN
jgi:hypothetical protein